MAALDSEAISAPSNAMAGRILFSTFSSRGTVSGYITNIERDTQANEDYRRVLFTGRHTQLVLMTLQPGDEIGREVHDGHDQFIRVESGLGVAVLDGEEHAISEGMAVVIPSGTEHNVLNTSAVTPLRLYTLYSPPEHPDGTVHRSKSDEGSSH